MKAERVDLRLAHGAETRRRVLGRAVQLASVEGLSALSIGRIADALGMSKAGVFAPFGSKEGLELAVVSEVRRDFLERVVTPALSAAEGLPRLSALCERWLAWAAEREGGCFFSRAASELAGRPGPVRDLVVTSVDEWVRGLTSVIEDARRLGHLDPAVDAEQLAFELHALELGGNAALQLFDDRRAVERAARAIAARIEGARADAEAKRAGGRRERE